MPTLLQRGGNFSQTYNSAGQLITVYDPATVAPDPNHTGQFIRQLFPGNLIPANRLNPVSQNILPYIPLPNTPGNPLTGVGNFASSASGSVPKNTGSIRIDHTFNDRARIFGRFSINDTSDLARPSTVRLPIFGFRALPRETTNTTSGRPRSITAKFFARI